MPKTFTDIAFADYLAWQAENGKVWQKINDLIKSIERDGPMRGLGKPEKLSTERANIVGELTEITGWCTKFLMLL